MKHNPSTPEPSCWPLPLNILAIIVSTVIEHHNENHHEYRRRHHQKHRQSHHHKHHHDYHPFILTTTMTTIMAIVRSIYTKYTRIVLSAHHATAVVQHRCYQHSNLGSKRRSLPNDHAMTYQYSSISTVRRRCL